jgi:hypothetical protein
MRGTEIFLQFYVNEPAELFKLQKKGEQARQGTYGLVGDMQSSPGEAPSRWRTSSSAA